MTLFFPLKRTTVLIPSGPQEDAGGKHLFIILTNQCPEKKVLRVSITTIRDGTFYDASCVLHPGDHPFIQKKSSVYYRSADAQGVDELVRGVKDGKLIPKESISETVFSFVCKGLLESPFTPQAAMTYYEANRHR